MDNINWLSFHSGYDFGYLLKLLTDQNLPQEENDFFESLRLYFPTVYDVKVSFQVSITKFSKFPSKYNNKNKSYIYILKPIRKLEFLIMIDYLKLLILILNNQSLIFLLKKL